MGEVDHVLPDVELRELGDRVAGPAPQAHPTTVRGTQPVRQVTRAANRSHKQHIQPDQINIAMFFWHLVKRNLPSVRYCTTVHWKSQFLQGARNTRSCKTGHSVEQRSGKQVQHIENSSNEPYKVS